MSWHRAPTLLAILLAVHATLLVAALGFVLGWWSSDSKPEASLAPISDAETTPAGIDGPSGSLFLITATPGDPQAPLATPTSAASQPPAAPAIATAPPVAPASGVADFSGHWRIVDVVTEGSNTGQTFSFDVSLTQDGDRITGGNRGIQISGVVRGDTATVEYTQPALGYSGSFVWTMAGPGRAEGSFTNSYPNAGTSTLQRLP